LRQAQVDEFLFEEQEESELVVLVEAASREGDIRWRESTPEENYIGK